MIIKASELDGAALDWAVAKATGQPLASEARLNNPIIIGRGNGNMRPFSPSTRWGDGGPLVDLYKPEFRARIDEGFECRIEMWEPGGLGYDEIKQLGSTHLIALARAIVAAEMGGKVDMPE